MHPLLSIVSTLAQRFLSGAINSCLPLFPSSLLNSFQPEGLIFWCHIFAVSYCSWGSPSKNTGVGCHFLLQEIYTNYICVLLLLFFSQSCLTICVVLYNLFYTVLACMISLYSHHGLFFLILHHG